MLTKDNFKKEYPKYLKELYDVRNKKYPDGVMPEHIALRLGMSTFSVYKWKYAKNPPKLHIINDLNRFKTEVSK